MSFAEFSKNFCSFIYRCFSSKKVAGKIRKLSIRLSRMKETLRLSDFETGELEL
jgi:hypothetical protein